MKTCNIIMRHSLVAFCNIVGKYYETGDRTQLKSNILIYVVTIHRITAGGHSSSQHMKHGGCTVF